MNRKSFIKGLLAGITGTVLFVSALSSASALEPYYKNIKAFVSSVKIFADGKPLNLQSEPLNIEGKVYLPLRDIGEALGKKIDWDGVNNSIFIGANKNAYRPSTGIYQLKPLYGETYFQVGYGGKDLLQPAEKGGKITLYRQNFSTINAIAFLNGSSIGFQLHDHKYYLIRGLAGVDDSNPSDSEKGIIKFYGDNKEIATITTGTKRDEPVVFEIDISNIEKLEVKNIKADGSASRVALVDVVLEAVQE
ncbi:stalk domain-containing protein [Calidifontibacillus erzurumensis]|uniref:NPCBM/NEW2 domain-containing protein n=1 Tax=Calidifontibacillus erzurumensis TaxID=2741433 RepID=A0A8J8GDQ7_9BACI|nr:stalk domain-containing protein [Calidifontibacillus erzurumensis]NSL51644.1 NPCBM/NEW2 domain-containing protein [Calidifontibacillus erzurumensis]